MEWHLVGAQGDVPPAAIEPQAPRRSAHRDDGLVKADALRRHRPHGIGLRCDAFANVVLTVGGGVVRERQRAEVVDIGAAAEQAPLGTGRGIDENIPFVAGRELVIPQHEAVGARLHGGILIAADDRQIGLAQEERRVATRDGKPRAPSANVRALREDAEVVAAGTGVDVGKNRSARVRRAGIPG